MPYCSFNLIKRREWGWGLNAMGEMTSGILVKGDSRGRGEGWGGGHTRGNGNGMK